MRRMRGREQARKAERSEGWNGRLDLGEVRVGGEGPKASIRGEEGRVGFDEGVVDADEVFEVFEVGYGGWEIWLRDVATLD